VTAAAVSVQSRVDNNHRTSGITVLGVTNRHPLLLKESLRVVYSAKWQRTSVRMMQRVNNCKERMDQLARTLLIVKEYFAVKLVKAYI
jgi:hypothetical protein